MASSLPLTFHFNHTLQHRPHFLTHQSHASSLSLPQSSKPSPNSHICFALSRSDSEREEEDRWLREEERWLREEKRWLREERRWNSEREALLLEIQALKLRVRELESRKTYSEGSVSETVANIAKLLQLLKEGELGKNIDVIAESGSVAVPLILEGAKHEEVIVNEAVKQEKVIREVPREAKKRLTLKRGSEGDDVRLMQEALLKLGFYCGEEDTEFSSFSSGTERAVKTWQATLGIKEDGIMTKELLEKLYIEQSIDIVRENPNQPDGTEPKANANGSPIASIMEIEEVKQTVVKEDSVSEAELSRYRVFLLGENRWEDPSRISTSKKPAEKKTASGTPITNCLTCRGEGRLLCLECDGTGEPNIEPQFLEWIDEETKCPYCEGLGFINCDVCEGKKLAEA